MTSIIRINVIEQVLVGFRLLQINPLKKHLENGKNA